VGKEGGKKGEAGGKMERQEEKNGTRTGLAGNHGPVPLPPAGTQIYLFIFIFLFGGMR
jgi:hypothetical protein